MELFSKKTKKKFFPVNFISLFVNRIQIQLQDFQNFFSKDIIASKPKSNLTKDKFGFRQLILISTSVGKVFAIHTESGEIVWKKFFPNHSFKSLIVTRGSAFYPPECLLLTETKAIWLNSLTGELNRKQELPFQILQTLVLPHIDSSGNKVVVAIDQSLQVHVLGSQEEFQKHANTTFFYFAKPSEKKITGYSIGNKVNRNKFFFLRETHKTKKFL